jgi:hypothetical protein
MKRAFHFVIIASVIFSLTGCASVRFYTKADLSGKTGLRFYTLKPYLLVEPHSEKDNTIKTSVVYLPDLANPQYISFRPGIGSSELKLAFTNGSLSSYGVVSDSRVPETINAIAGLVSKGSEAVTRFVQPGNGVLPLSTDENFKLYEIVFGPDCTNLKEVTEIKK